MPTFSRKPVIAMAHLPSLPGTPGYDVAGGIATITNVVERDLEHLLVDGVDAVMFCNEGDRPYQLHAGPEIVATMAAVVAKLAPTDRPFGVDVLWDPAAALGLAVGTGAAFLREVISGTYESDMGLWQPDAASLGRERSRLRAEEIELWFNITPEYARRLSDRSLGDVARSVLQSCLPDVILVSGPMAGVEPDISLVEEAKEAVGDGVKVYVNTGVKSHTVEKFLSVADGVIVGSDFKVDGNTWNPVDPARVDRFLQAAASAR